MPLFEDLEQNNNIKAEPKSKITKDFQSELNEMYSERNKRYEFNVSENQRWVQNIVSPEKIAEWEKQGTMSALDVFSRKEKNELVPFMGTITQANKNIRIRNISDAMRKGLYISPEDKAFYEQFVLDMAEIQTRGYTFGGKVVNTGLETLPFMVEFGAGLLTTGGASSLGATAAKIGVKGAIKKATSEALEGASKKIAEEGVMKTLGKGVGKVAYDATLNPRTYAFAATRLPQQVFARYSDIMLSDSLAVSEEGQAILLEAKEKPATAFVKALSLTNIEVASEMAGATLLKPTGAALNRFIAPKIMSKLPEKFATRFTKVAEEVTGMPFVKGVEALGFNGLIEEMGEERVGDILRFAFNLDEKEGYSFEQFLDAAFPSAEQLAVEAVTFGAMGVGAGLADAGLKKVSKKYSKDEFLVDAGVFRQAGKDSLLDSQVRSKLEEAGVPEEDIESALQFGTREQKLDFVRNNINNQSELSKEIETDWYNKLVEAGAQHEQAYRSAKLMSVFIDRFGADEKVKKQWYDKLVVTNKKVEEGKKIALGQAQFQFAGEKSKTANKYSLQEAQRQLDNGVDAETVRQQTGWFKGVDGKFRYEISDNEAEFTELFDRAIKVPELWAEYDVENEKLSKEKSRLFEEREKLNARLSELYSVVDSENEVLTSEQKQAQKEIEKLQKEYTKVEEEYEKVRVKHKELRDEFNEKLKGTNFLKVGDVLKHDKLFAAYPELKNIGFEFRKLDGKTQGYYSDYEIVIDNNVSKDRALEIIMHEIQHYIQDVEGFARGGSPETIKRLFQRVISKIENSDDLIEYENLMKEYSIVNDALLVHSVNNKPENVVKTYWWLQKGKGWYAPKKTSKKARKEYIDDCCEELLEFLQEKNKQKGTDIEYQEYLQQDTKTLRNKANNLQRKAWKKLSKVDIKTKEKFKDALKKVDDFKINNEYLYVRLSGEVEARATEKRLDLTEEQRYSSAYNPYNTALFGYDVEPEEQYVIFSDGTSVPYNANNPSVYYQGMIEDTFNLLSELITFKRGEKAEEIFDKIPALAPLKEYFGESIKGVRIKKMPKWMKLTAKDLGGYLPLNKTIYINDEYVKKFPNKRQQFIRTILHEFVHAKQKYLYKYAKKNLNNKSFTKEEKQDLQKYIDMFEASDKETQAFKNFVDKYNEQDLKNNKELVGEYKKVYNGYINALKEKDADNVALALQSIIGESNNELIRRYSYALQDAERSAQASKTKEIADIRAFLARNNGALEQYGRLSEQVNTEVFYQSARNSYNEEKKNLVADVYKDQVKFYNGEWIHRSLLEKKGIDFEKVEIGDYLDYFEESKREPRAEYNPEFDNVAKEYFGTTTNLNEAGYILNDGSLLDLSGKNMGGAAGRRSIDHREVNSAFIETENPDYEDVGFNEFIDNGAIRFMPEANSFLIARMPSEKQFDELKKIIDKKNGEVFIELVDEMEYWGSERHSFRKEYERFSNVDKILDDVRTFFNGGKISKFKTYLQSAYHGTPHRFDEFLLDHIGTGEGHIAHGWGLYFAQNKDVSENYRERLTTKGLRKKISQVMLEGEVIENAHNATLAIGVKNTNKENVLERIERDIKHTKRHQKEADEEDKKAYQAILDNLYKDLEFVQSINEDKIEILYETGQLFEVDIPENDVLLDEDKKLNEQPEKVRKAIWEYMTSRPDDYNMSAIKDYNHLPNYDGKWFYKEVAFNERRNGVIGNGYKEASLLLNKLGIKGITYDGMQDGRCYVIFDDKAIKVLNTFYQEEGEINNNFHDLLNLAREKKEQQENEYYGYFVSAEDKNVLSIMQNHNASTIIHEMGHLFLDGLNEFAKFDSEAAEQLAAVNEWLGSDGVYTVAQQEKFARSFEAYLYRGKAPSSMLRKVFEAFKEWMKKIYLDITSIQDADISDEAVEVFDRIFYGNEYAEKNKQIKQLLNKIKTLRADDELTDTQKRHRDIAYHIVSLATGKDEKYLKRILENKHPNKSVKKQQENIEFLLEKTDDKISSKDGFLPEWLEFFDEAELYEDETKLAFAAYDTILAGNYRNDATFADEDYLSYLDAQYNYILKEYQKAPYDRDVVLGAYYEWLASIDEQYLENYAERFNADIEYIERRENMDKFERAKEDILSAARSAKNPYSLNTVEVYKDFVLSIMKNLDFLQPIDKARLTTNILENTSVAMLEARIDNILDIAKTMEDLAYRRELVKKIRAELQGTKNVKQGARTVGKYDYKTNKLFERLRELDNLTVEQANDMRLSEEMLMRAQDEGLSFEDKMINRFLTFKANGNTYGTTENIKALFDDIVKIKNAARDAKNEQEMFDKLNLEKNVQELIDIVEAKKEPKAVKWYMQLLGNWESSLNALFNKDIKDEYSLLLAETAADVWIYEQKKKFEDAIAGIYGLNSWNFDKELLKGLSEQYTFNERVRDYDKDFNLIRERIVEKKMNRLEILLAYIWNKNELMRKRLINMFGEDTLDEMFEVLSVEDKKLGDFMVRMASGFYPEVNDAFIKKYGLDLPKISAYFPSRAEREGSEVDMFNDFTSQTKNDSFTKNRTKSETIALEFGNPIEMLYSHIDGVGKFVYMGERLDKLNKIFKNKTLKRTLKNKYGNDVYKSLFQTLTNVTYKAAPPVYSLHGKILNNVISNWIQGNVIFRPIVGLKQLLAANNYAADMPYLDWHIGYLKAIANFKSTIDYMTKIPYLKARFGGSGANEFLKDTINNSAFAASKKFKDLLAMNIKMGDIGAIVFGGKPYIDYLIKQGKTEEEAIKQFVLMTQRTQQSSAISSLSNFQVAMSRNPIGKLFTAYKNSPYQYIRMCGDAIVSVANGDMTLKECAKIIYHFAYVQPLLYTLATSGSILTWLATGDDDELKADLFSTLFNLNADALAFIGDAYKFAIEKLILKEKYMPSTTPLLGDLQMEIMKLSKKEVSAKDYFHAAGYGVHLLTGVDANAVGNSVAGLGDIAKGDVAKGTLRAVGYTENRAKRIVGEKDKKKK